MSDAELKEWIHNRRLRPTKAAAIFDISLSTLQNILGGRRPAEETIEKIVNGMKQYDLQKPEKKAG